MIEESLYKKIIHCMPICTVDIIFVDCVKKKILLGKRTNEPLKEVYYSIGGRLRKNEKFKNAACRIAKDELGVVLKSDKLVLGGVMDEQFSNSMFEDESLFSVNIFYYYRVNNQNKYTLDKQHSEISWFNYNDPTLHPNLQSKLQNISLIS